MNRNRSFYVLSALAALLGGCGKLEPGEFAGETIPVAEQALTGSPELLFGAAAVASLPSARQTLFTSLAAASTVPPDATVDATSKAVLGLSLSWWGGKPTATDNALKFVSVYQALLDSRVSAAEYIVGSSNQPCADSVVVLDRVVAGQQVVGSRLTLHFDENGRLVYVTNGVAPVPATLVTVDPLKLPGNQSLAKLMGQIPTKVAKRIPVLVPMADGSGLYKGDLATWFNNGRYRAAIAIGDTATSRELDAQAQGAGRAALPAPTGRASSDTDVPSQMSYRSLGGVKVNFLGGERNPLESAYRFLDEHPTLFHTGSARCQYVPARLSENPKIPGVFTARLDQRHGKLPVFGAQLVVRLEGFDTVTQINARARGNVTVAPTASVTTAQAIAAVKTALTSGMAADPAWKIPVNDALARTATTRLVVMPQFLSQNPQIKTDRLAWRVDQGAFTMLVDALTQQILWGTTSRHSANVVKDGRGSDEFGYLFYPTAEINGIPQPGAPSPPNADVTPGRPGGRPAVTMGSYSALLARQGWNGQRGNGGDFIASTNVNVSSGCLNAFFDSTFTNSAFFCLGMASIDVVAHEFTHGVIAASSGLTYADQSGAINEAYADLFGNLNDVASSTTATRWLVGEQSARGTLRDMMNPGAFGQPAHMSAYAPRGAGCMTWPWSCDNGGVHTNSGIINRAHALLADGLPGFVAGIGRDRLERLAFFVMTQELPSNATMNQVASATRDVCDMFVARGVLSSGGLSYTNAHCDAVTNAFNQVGLNPSLASGWLEPALGFSGTELIHAGAGGVPDLTPGLCPVTNIFLRHSVPVLGTTLTADYNPATPMGSRNTILDGVATTGFNFTGLSPTVPAPLGTPIMAHSVDWTSVYGVRPTFATDVVYSSGCTPPPVQERTSATFTEGFETGWWTGSDSPTVGNPAPASLNATCVFPLVGGTPAVELLDGDGFTRIAGPEQSVSHTITRWFVFVPVDFTARASAVTRPAGRNMSGVINTSWDLGRTVRVRWRYTFQSAADCNPR